MNKVEELLKEIENVNDRYIEDFNYHINEIERWLSNYHLIDIEYEGVIYPSTEHAFQAAKTLDIEERKKILYNTDGSVTSCKDARLMGRKITMRSDWEDVKVNIMLELNKQKFRDLILMQRLLDTGDMELIEGNWWNDVFWGVCNGVGKNMLGKILMQIREELREDDDEES